MQPPPPLRALRLSSFPSSFARRSLGGRKFRTLSERRVPANHARPFTQSLDRPSSPSDSSKIFPSQVVTSSPTLRLHKSFSCNTYGSPRKCCKQKTYGLAKPFRCNTYKKQGVGAPPSTFRRMPSSISTAPSRLPIPAKDITHVRAIIGGADCGSCKKASQE